MLVGSAADKLCGDANVRAVSDHRALDHGIHAEYLRDLRHGELRVLEAHHRGVGDDPQIVNAGEPVDKGLGEAVGEIVLRWIAGKITEWKDGEGMDGSRGRGRGLICRTMAKGHVARSKHE